jgi:RNA methyltransferase, TrmH family
MTITSPHNERLKELRKLQDRKHRERTKLFFAEGEDMLAEALRWGAHPKTVFYDPDGLAADGPPLSGLPSETELVAVEREALRRAGTLGSGSRLIGVWEQGSGRAAEKLPVTVYLHEVMDPGNVGTVLRSALALIRSTVVLSPGTADPFSPKAVRAGMGAIFGQPVVRASFEEVALQVPAGTQRIALVPGTGKTLREADLRPPIVFCLGSERRGLPGEIIAGCEEVCHVPLRADGAESLNVAITATLCLYELSLHKLSSSP